MIDNEIFEKAFFDFLKNNSVYLAMEQESHYDTELNRVFVGSDIELNLSIFGQNYYSESVKNWQADMDGAGLFPSEKSVNLCIQEIGNSLDKFISLVEQQIEKNKLNFQKQIIENKYNNSNYPNWINRLHDLFKIEIKNEIEITKHFHSEFETAIDFENRFSFTDFDLSFEIEYRDKLIGLKRNYIEYIKMFLEYEINELSGIPFKPTASTPETKQENEDKKETLIEVVEMKSIFSKEHLEKAEKNYNKIKTYLSNPLIKFSIKCKRFDNELTAESGIFNHWSLVFFDSISLYEQIDFKHNSDGFFLEECIKSLEVETKILPTYVILETELNFTLIDDFKECCLNLKYGFKGYKNWCKRNLEGIIKNSLFDIQLSLSDYTNSSHSFYDKNYQRICDLILINELEELRKSFYADITDFLKSEINELPHQPTNKTEDKKENEGSKLKFKKKQDREMIMELVYGLYYSNELETTDGQELTLPLILNEIGKVIELDGFNEKNLHSKFSKHWKKNEYYAPNSCTNFIDKMKKGLTEKVREKQNNPFSKD